MKADTRKRLAALGLTTVMALSLAACGEKAPSHDEVEQAIEAGTLTIEDALDKGWVDQEWVDSYYEENSVPAVSKMESHIVGDFTTTTLSGDEFTKEQLGSVVLFAFIDPNTDGAQDFYDALAESYDDVIASGAEILVCSKSETGIEMFDNAPFSVVFCNDSLRTAMGASSEMLKKDALPNIASWYVNGSFLSAWYVEVNADELSTSAADWVKISLDQNFKAK